MPETLPSCRVRGERHWRSQYVLLEVKAKMISHQSWGKVAGENRDAEDEGRDLEWQSMRMQHRGELASFSTAASRLQAELGGWCC